MLLFKVLVLTWLTLEKCKWMQSIERVKTDYFLFQYILKCNLFLWLRKLNFQHHYSCVLQKSVKNADVVLKQRLIIENSCDTLYIYEKCDTFLPVFWID